MAKISFSFEELLEILIANRLLPRQIMRARVKGQTVHFILKTNSLIVPFIPASLRYLSFENSKAIFELTVVSGRLNKAVAWLNEAFKPQVPEYVKLDYPNIYIDINTLLQENNVRGIRIKEIFFEDAELTIVTANN